ncbi:hypothetical protein XELAEV_18034082mg [Xenopus laevis]|uniref:Fucolectin tachylectin-4 pentraxin-1 domain-containing protein n=1 Tax=Xenopus laevis TaxID=8355 RepID=A0A974HEJ9_XENLA|nr:hypothetical protein XELAEV_18034082mg [Xenopus laevis]
MKCIVLLLVCMSIGWVHSIPTKKELRLQFKVQCCCCSLTGNDKPSWWRLALTVRYKVEKVVIVNRGDCLLGAEIHVGDTEDLNNPLCGTVTDVSEETITLSCHGMVGQYVTVSIPEREEYLQLCEVEVYGNKYNDVASDIHWLIRALNG